MALGAHMLPYSYMHCAPHQDGVLHVTSPLGHSVRVNRVYKNCHLMIHDREFSVDLIDLPFHEFDLILGMNWLSKH